MITAPLSVACLSPLFVLLGPALASPHPQGLQVGAAGGAQRSIAERRTPFVARHAFAGDIQASDFVVGDFGLDGDPDVAVLCRTRRTRGWSRSSPATLAPPALIDPSPGALLTPGDLNGDEFEDFVVSQVGNLTTWLGNGDGTFSSPGAPVSVPASTYVRPVLGDFDEDGRQDLAWGQAVQKLAGTRPRRLVGRMPACEP